MKVMLACEIYKGLCIYNYARARIDREEGYQHQSYDWPTG